MIKKSMLILPILLSSLYSSANDNKMLYLMGEWDLKLKDKKTEEIVKINLNELHKKNRILGNSDKLGRVACQKNIEFNFVELMKAFVLYDASEEELKVDVGVNNSIVKVEVDKSIEHNEIDTHSYICYFFDEDNKDDKEPNSLMFIGNSSKNTLKGIYYADGLEKVIDARLSDILNKKQDNEIMVNGVRNISNISKEIEYINKMINQSAKFKKSNYGKTIHSNKINIVKEFLDFDFASYVTSYISSDGQKVLITQPVLKFKKDISSDEMKNLSLDDKKAVLSIINIFYIENLFYTNIKIKEKELIKKLKSFLKRDNKEILNNKPFKKLFKQGEELKLGYFESVFDSKGKYISTKEKKIKKISNLYEAKNMHKLFVKSLF